MTTTRTDACLTIRPGVASGAPCIGRTGTAAWAIAGCLWAGDSVDDIADEYGVTREEILVACWFLATYGVEAAWWNRDERRRAGAGWTKRWGPWASEHVAAFWHHNFDAIPDPPNRDA